LHVKQPDIVRRLRLENRAFLLGPELHALELEAAAEVERLRREMLWRDAEEVRTLKAEIERLRHDWAVACKDLGEARAEVERLQGHMRALADTSVARDTAAIFKGLWQGSEHECEQLRAEVERLRAAAEGK
jgi:hypothetical protein